MCEFILGYTASTTNVIGTVYHLLQWLILVMSTFCLIVTEAAVEVSGVVSFCSISGRSLLSADQGVPKGTRSHSVQGLGN